MDILTLMALAATRLPVLGMVETTKETFSGTAFGAELTFTSDRGCRCRAELRDRRALVDCSDGRSGYLTWRPASRGGVARGTLGGEPVTVVVGP